MLVGQRLRELRMLAGLSQSDLAATIGLTFQQLQKYERGVNRISASKLYLLARHLNVPVSTFFADLEGARGDGSATAGNEAGVGVDIAIHSREALVLARHYQRIRDPKVKAAIKSFFETCAGSFVGETMAEAETEAGAEAGSPREPSAAAAAEARPSTGEAGGEAAGEAGGEAGDEAQPGTGKRRRRPRGAVWHPADISRAR